MGPYRTGSCYNTIVITMLTGANDFLIKQTIDEMIHQFEASFGVNAIERVDGEGLDSTRLSELVQNVSLFATERMVVVRGAAKNKSLWEALADWCDKMPQETHLVLIEPTPDKRTKTYKLLQKQSDFRHFEELSEKELITWITHTAESIQKTIDIKTAMYLIQRVGGNQLYIWQELQKLIAADRIINTDLIDLLVEPNPQTSVFEVLDAALDRKLPQVQLLIKHIETREDPYRFFGLLVAQIQTLITVKSAGTRSADIVAKEAGIHPFVVRKAQSLARNISQDGLMSLTKLLSACDAQLKSVNIEPWFLLEQCLNRITVQIIKSS